MNMMLYNLNKEIHNLVVVESIGSLLGIRDLTTIDILKVYVIESISYPAVGSLRRYIRPAFESTSNLLIALPAVNIVYRVDLVLGKYPVDRPIYSIDGVIDLVTSTIYTSVSSHAFQAKVRSFASLYNATGLEYVDITVTPLIVVTHTDRPPDNIDRSILPVGSDGFISVITIAGGFFLSICALVTLILTKRYLRREKDKLLEQCHVEHTEAHIDAFEHPIDEEITDLPIGISYSNSDHIEMPIIVETPKALVYPNENDSQSATTPVAKTADNTPSSQADGDEFPCMPSPNSSPRRAVDETQNDLRSDDYDGDTEDGQRHGWGTLRYTNGSIYQGEWLKGSRHGKGTYTSSSGTIYEGTFVNNKLVGVVKYMYTNGNYYVGTVENGRYHGKGLYVYGNGPRKGEVFEGEYKVGRLNGEGQHHLPDGTYYEGHFADGLYDGYGTFYSASDEVVFKGLWRAGNQDQQEIGIHNLFGLL